MLLLLISVLVVVLVLLLLLSVSTGVNLGAWSPYDPPRSRRNPAVPWIPCSTLRLLAQDKGGPSKGGFLNN